MSIELFTVGHSNLSGDQFVALLEQHGIELLIDIRRFPGSRAFPQFHQEALSRLLGRHGIKYRWMEELGGRRPKQHLPDPELNAGLRNASFRNYGDYMQTSAFQAGLSELIEAASQQRTAIMCSEAVYWRCHRRLVSDAIVARGGTVQHLFSGGEMRPHQLTPGARISGNTVTYPAEPSLFERVADSSGE